MAQHRDRPRASLSFSPEASAALDEMADAFYGGNMSRAADAAVLAWFEVLMSPSSHGLASKPADALRAYVEAQR